MDQHPLLPYEIYRRKFAVSSDDRIATAGSCFAQHIARRLRGNKYNVIDEEPPPPGLTEQQASSFGYGLYSARYGNIYTVRQLLQLAQESLGLFDPAKLVWEKNGRYFDSLRPSVEPNGLDDPDMVLEHRKQHLRAVRRVLEKATLFVFTFGLTEAWEDKDTRTVYPTAPGTIAGSFDPAEIEFKNFSYAEVLADFQAFFQIMQGFNKDVRFLLTVSPVPLTATATNDHVLSATTYSKSVLRAVAGYLANNNPNIDYFPSYEIIAGLPARGFFYESNLRNISPSGVDVVMRCFFDQHLPIKDAEPVGAAQLSRGGPAAGSPDLGPVVTRLERDAEEVVCEEALLEAFSR